MWLGGAFWHPQPSPMPSGHAAPLVCPSQSKVRRQSLCCLFYCVVIMTVRRVGTRREVLMQAQWFMLEEVSVRTSSGLKQHLLCQKAALSPNGLRRPMDTIPSHRGQTPWPGDASGHTNHLQWQRLRKLAGLVVMFASLLLDGESHRGRGGRGRLRWAMAELPTLTLLMCDTRFHLQSHTLTMLKQCSHQNTATATERNRRTSIWILRKFQFIFLNVFFL